jgi:methyl-accepting chemotaxis protein
MTPQELAAQLMGIEEQLPRGVATELSSQMDTLKAAVLQHTGGESQGYTEIAGAANNVQEQVSNVASALEQLGETLKAVAARAQAV